MDNSTEHELTLLPPTERIREESYDLHAQFNKEVWGGKESFHNEKHIKAVGDVADRLIDAAIYGGVDPLNLEGELTKWKNLPENSDAQISFSDDFKKVYRIAIAAHDWGNIMANIQVVDGKLVPTFLDGYKASGAEDRAIAFVKLAIENDPDLTEDEKKRYVPFAQHLIDQTRFMFSPEDKNGERPFAKAMRFMDQIGNDLFTQNEDAIIGLMREQVYEKPDTMQSVSFYHNFVRARIDALVPKESQAEVFAVLRKQYPEENIDYPEQKVLIANYLVAHDLVKENPQGLTSYIEQEFKERTGQDITEYLKQPRTVNEIDEKLHPKSTKTEPQKAA